MIYPQIEKYKILFIGDLGDRNLPNDFEIQYIKPHEITHASGILATPQPENNLDWMKETKIPIGLIWYDSIVYSEIIEKTNCLHFILDDQNYQSRHKIVKLWSPLNNTIRHPECPRSIDVNFIGNVDNNQRKQTLRYLLNKGINVFTIGNQDWNKVDYHIMQYYMQMSKITINFSKNRFVNRYSFKGRVIEAMQAGSMVLEDVNDNTNQYFNENDMVWFQNDEDLLTKIKFYLEKDQERIRIANNGQLKCISKYNIYNWWKIILGNLLDLPHLPHAPSLLL